MAKSRNHLLNKVKSISKYDGKVADVLKNIINSSIFVIDDGIPSFEGHDHDDLYYTKAYIDSNFYTAAYTASHFANITHTHTTADITDLSSYTGLDVRYYQESEINSFFSGSTSITGYNKSNWDTAFSWGNHASAGYALGSAISGTSGYLPIFNSSSSVANSVWLQSSNTLIGGNTTLGSNLRVVSHSYGNTGLFESYGSDGALKFQAGAGSATTAYVYAHTGIDLLLYAGGSANLRLKSSGTIISHGAVDTGEAFIIGGNTRVNGAFIARGSGSSIIDPSNTFGLAIGAASASPNWIAVGTSGSGVPQIQGYNNAFSSEVAIALQPNGNRVIVGSTTDNGVDMLQVNGSGKFVNAITASSFINSASSNSFFLLGGGGTVAISNYQLALSGTGLVKSTAGAITYITDNTSNWDTAFSWGNHASAGYLLSSSYTSADVLTKIKTVDGTGSGLDADLLDGNHASAFYLASNPSGFITAAQIPIAYAESYGSGSVVIDDSDWTEFSISSSPGPRIGFTENSGKITYEAGDNIIVRVVVSISSRLASIISGSIQEWKYCILLDGVEVTSSIQDFHTDGEYSNCCLVCLLEISTANVISVAGKSINSGSSGNIDIDHFNLTVHRIN